MVICGRLRTLRAERKLSQRDIAKRTGLERRYISKVESGYIVPTVESLEKIAGALEVPLYRLFYDDEALPRLGNLPNRKTCDDIAWGSSGKNTRISAPARPAQRVSPHGADDTGSREHHHKKTGKQLQAVVNPRMNQTVAAAGAFRRQTAGGAPVMR